MIKEKDTVAIINKDLELYDKTGRVLFINKEFKNAYVMINKERFLIDLKDLMSLQD